MPTEGQRRSRKQEERLEREFGGQRSAASGAFWSRKGDVRSDEYLIEAKTTLSKGYRLTLAALVENERHAVLDGRVPLFEIEFAGGARPRSFVVMAREDFDALREE